MTDKLVFCLPILFKLNDLRTSLHVTLYNCGFESSDLFGEMFLHCDVVKLIITREDSEKPCFALSTLIIIFTALWYE